MLCRIKAYGTDKLVFWPTFYYGSKILFLMGTTKSFIIKQILNITMASPSGSSEDLISLGISYCIMKFY